MNWLCYSILLNPSVFELSISIGTTLVSETGHILNISVNDDPGDALYLQAKSFQLGFCGRENISLAVCS